MRTNSLYARLGMLVAVLCLVGCGREAHFQGFEEYVTAFEVAAGQRDISISHGSLIIEYGDVGSMARARCDHGFLQSPTILVNKGNWDTQNETTREMIIFHELGHCLLGRGHVTDIERGVPKSLMHPGEFDWATYINRRVEYLNELFGKEI